MRHKKILDVAAEYPTASVDSLAEKVPSATPDLVENVLEEYGDPASEESSDGDQQSGESTTDSDAGQQAADATTDADVEQRSEDATADEADESEAHTDTDGGESADEEPPSDGSDYPDPEDLSERERATLEVVAEHPEASQRDVAARMDVTAATISNRLNGIEGFDWADRQAFATTVLDAEADPEQPETDGATVSDPEMTQTQSDQPDIETLHERIVTVERQLEQLDGAPADDPAAFEDPELVHKIVHACLESERISEDEELEILEQFL